MYKSHFTSFLALLHPPSNTLSDKWTNECVCLLLGPMIRGQQRHCCYENHHKKWTRCKKGQCSLQSWQINNQSYRLAEGQNMVNKVKISWNWKESELLKTKSHGAFYPPWPRSASWLGVNIWCSSRGPLLLLLLVRNHCSLPGCSCSSCPLTPTSPLSVWLCHIM